MKFKFDAEVGYQQDAVDAVVSVFKDQPLTQSDFELGGSSGQGLAFSDHGVGNNITWNDAQLLSNVRQVQETNGIERSGQLEGRNFSVEMETGTGKTYVYLRSIFELATKYGLKKFIVVVPSVAVREGVLKSISIMKSHFGLLYNNTPFNHFVYDSRKLSHVRQFANGNAIQIMVINIQSFSKDVADKDTADMTDTELKKLNVINRENDRLSGHKPIDFIRATNPVVIIDEPQSVDSTEKAQRAIEKLNPVATLRYSATHRKHYNLLYKLDSVQAHDLGLVKRIEVASVRSESGSNEALVKLLNTDNKKGIRAQVEIHNVHSGKARSARLWVKVGDDLYIKSGRREIYRDGYVVQGIDCTPGKECIELSGGKRFGLGEEKGAHYDDIMKAQVYTTVEQHLKKEMELKSKGIKVLSLFFIDKVANYRTYNSDGSTELGKIGRWFEDAYENLSKKLNCRRLIPFDVSRLHDGYFSKDRKGRAKDTRGNTKDDDDTYNLIMRDKEKLLDPDEPLRFIFSHSALREGWDNPNVFQICTLNETQSKEKKRQEIGRGLRLPVDSDGKRIYDEDINRLVVVANESYDDFARALQNELEEDCGIQFGRIEAIVFSKITRRKDGGTDEAIGEDASKRVFDAMVSAGYVDAEGVILDAFCPEDAHFRLEINEKYKDIEAQIVDVMKGFVFKNRIPKVRERQRLTLNDEVYLSKDFKLLWDAIKHRTRYRVAFNTNGLIENAVERIKKLEKIGPQQINITRKGIDISRGGVDVGRTLQEKRMVASSPRVLPDLLAAMQKETELTRQTLVKILKNSGRLAEYQNDPGRFITLVGQAISRALQDLMLDGIQYEKINGRYWEMTRIKKDAENGLTRYWENLYKVQNTGKSLFDYIEHDSGTEKEFAEDLDGNEDIRLFVKLPAWFKIETPIGSYNPDWAFFVSQSTGNVYFVQETKGTLDEELLRPRETKKIEYGKQHFKSIGVKYRVATKLSDVW